MRGLKSAGEETSQFRRLVCSAAGKYDAIVRGEVRQDADIGEGSGVLNHPRNGASLTVTDLQSQQAAGSDHMCCLRKQCPVEPIAVRSTVEGQERIVVAYLGLQAGYVAGGDIGGVRNEGVE